MATARLQREARTMEVMLHLYCDDHHAPQPRRSLCEPCAALHEYARKRLAGCPYGPDKPTCANCVIHCYGPRQREAVRQVMRYAGPRMLLRHPVLALAHLLDGRRPAPPKPRGGVTSGRPASPDGGGRV
ncbi:MAG: nitrous oxide-stimulated promoter family protein [Rubrivivax sp.]|nr:nitrous oxide-stimulated promoter family protein [Rubrivivax sp.]